MSKTEKKTNRKRQRGKHAEAAEAAPVLDSAAVKSAMTFAPSRSVPAAEMARRVAPLHGVPSAKWTEKHVEVAVKAYHKVAEVVGYNSVASDVRIELNELLAKRPELYDRIDPRYVLLAYGGGGGAPPMAAASPGAWIAGHVASVNGHASFGTAALGLPAPTMQAVAGSDYLWTVSGPNAQTRETICNYFIGRVQGHGSALAPAVNVTAHTWEGAAIDRR